MISLSDVLLSSGHTDHNFLIKLCLYVSEDPVCDYHQPVFLLLVLPVFNKSNYSTILMFLISLGVGAFVANGIICLIPEVGI